MAAHADNAWTVRNVGTGQYLGILGARMGDATPVVAVQDPFAWEIWPDVQDRSYYRLLVPGQPRPINVELSDHGNPANGTPIQLWDQWQGLNQCWGFEQA
ncbi:hypothetical protein GFY24_24595 [Nocardia sp. SYP-A9097]|uniref:RICIN domain-containing protein n=1 Tax=Nocardia sp. SYP-A9097 TaxID=2663237 RepID=UPI0013267A9A|nr:hypothetical protein [Nocardia sp. SYP-A9097]